MKQRSGFDKYELHERVRSALLQLGFRRPTAVQEKVIPQFIQHRNLIVEAPTGTGKTAAYGLPLISQLNLHKRSTQALVLTPSRELALQISQALQSYFEGDLLKVGAVYGGSSLDESCQAIKSAPHILVAVPGRLKDVMSQFQYDFLWRDIKYLIVDEGDKLLEAGFQQDLDDIRGNVRKRAQLAFFSATIPEDAETLIRERIPRIKTIRLSPKQMLKNIRFAYVKAKEGAREPYLAALLKQEKIDTALLFTSKREDIYALIGFLRKLGYLAEGYFGAQEQQERANILNRFKSGHIDFLVASDLAARGLDIPDLPVVINLAMPEEFDFYLHRVGRTGRAGHKGKVYNLVLNRYEQQYMKNHHRLMELPISPLEVDVVDTQELEVDKADKWVKFHLSRGKQDKIRKGDVVGFLINEAQLEADEIGTITIYDSYAVVDMPLKGFQQLEQKDKLTLKGKTVKVRKFQVEEQARKAQAVKRLLKDRRKG